MVERVAFDSPVENPDGRGGTITGFQEQYVCDAMFRYLRGSETVIAARLEGRQPVVVTVHDCSAASAVRAGWRMRDLRRGTEYNIRTIVPSDDRVFLEITCESGVAV